MSGCFKYLVQLQIDCDRFDGGHVAEQDIGRDTFIDDDDQEILGEQVDFNAF